MSAADKISRACKNVNGFDDDFKGAVREITHLFNDTRLESLMVTLSDKGYDAPESNVREDIGNFLKGDKYLNQQRYAYAKLVKEYHIYFSHKIGVAIEEILNSPETAQYISRTKEIVVKSGEILDDMRDAGEVAEDVEGLPFNELTAKFKHMIELSEKIAEAWGQACKQTKNERRIMHGRDYQF